MSKLLLLGFLVVLMATGCNKTGLVQNTPTKTNQASNSNSEIADWETYENKKFGFSMKVSPSWDKQYLDSQEQVWDEKGIHEGYIKSDRENANTIYLKFNKANGDTGNIGILRVEQVKRQDVSKTIPSNFSEKKSYTKNGINYDEYIIPDDELGQPNENINTKQLIFSKPVPNKEGYVYVFSMTYEYTDKSKETPELDLLVSTLHFK